MKRALIVLSLLTLLVGGWFFKSGRPWLHAVQTYIYGFPMIVMDLTREQMTAVSKPDGMNAPVNQFGVMSSFPDVTFRAIPRTGLDSLFATSWVDLGDEPMVLSIPDTSGRYYVIALFDYWSNVFASIGSRTTGMEAGHYLIAGPGWQGEVPEDIDGVYHSPTRWVWVNGQMRADGKREEKITTALQEQYLLTPFSKWGRPYTPPAEVPLAQVTVPKIAPPDQIKKMTAQQFFGRLAQLMGDNPPAPADNPLVDKLKGLGVVPGEDFDISKLTPGQRKALERAMNAFGLLEKGVQKLETNQGWIVIPPNFANYGTDYVTRAGIALIGLGGIWPADILYPTAFLDSKDKPLDGSKKYVLHFDKGMTPPAKVVWSVSMYDPDGFYVPNSIDRYNVASRMPLAYNQDGSLDLYIQSESPGPEKEANWLPAPSSGPFNLVTRIFWPENQALNGEWQMPGVKVVP